MNPVLTRTTEAIARPEYPPERGNLASIFGLTYPGAEYGIITLVDDSDAVIGTYLVNITWYAPKVSARKRAHPEAQDSRAARRVALNDQLTITNRHYEGA